MTCGTITAEEFADILERNGYHTASADVVAGVDWCVATAYVLADFANEPHYRDGEEAWLRAYVRRLHAEEVTPPN